MTFTLLLTDVEGSTRLWEADRQAMAGALARHDRLVSQAVADHGGRLVKAKGEGDSTFSVFTSPAQGRYRMLETIRQFAWDKLVEADEAEGLRGRHRDWCLALAEAADFNGPAATAWLARLAVEQDNFRAALEWEGPTGDDGAERLRLGGALREFWWSQAQSGEGRHWLERALGAAPDAPAAAKATALLGAGLLAGEQGDAASARTFLRQSHVLYEQLGDRCGLAQALVGLGETAMMQGRYRQARALLEQAVREARAAGDQPLAALALNFVGNGLYLQGDWTAARPVYEQVREGFQAIGNPHGVAVVAASLASPSRGAAEPVRCRPRLQ
jgi:tetratricopeptide (TPR) repeat protein